MSYRRAKIGSHVQKEKLFNFEITKNEAINKIFIDFEGISGDRIKWIKEYFIPSAFSIGVFVENNKIIEKLQKEKFVLSPLVPNLYTYTFVIEFDYLETLDNAYNQLKSRLKHLIKLFKNIFKDEFTFFGYSSDLESKIFKKINIHYPIFSILNSMIEQNISLKLLTRTLAKDENYFLYFKKNFLNSREHLKKTIERGSGRVASVASQFLANSSKAAELNDIKPKLNNKSKRKIWKELIQYSKSDIERMGYIFQNTELIKDKIIQILKFRDILQKLNNNKQSLINQNRKCQKFINLLYKDKTIWKLENRPFTIFKESVFFIDSNVKVVYNEIVKRIAYISEMEDEMNNSSILYNDFVEQYPSLNVKLLSFYKWIKNFLNEEVNEEMFDSSIEDLIKFIEKWMKKTKNKITQIDNKISKEKALIENV